METATTSKPKTYGFRISRTGNVFAYLAPAYHGRVSKNDELLAGSIWREGREWRNDQCSDRFRTQEDAATMLMRIVFGGVATA
jgi:hypothetical protein